MNTNIIKAEIKNSIEVKSLMLEDEDLVNNIHYISQQCINSLKTGGKIIFCGNGGSFADAQHLSAEFTSRFMFDRPGLASIALGTNSSTLTAIGNDYGYEKIFSRELESIGDKKDFIIAITTSGNSDNILRLLQTASNLKIPFTVFTGLGMGKLLNKYHTINIPSTDTARIQECHILIGHIICGIVESQLFKEK